MAEQPSYPLEMFVHGFHVRYPNNFMVYKVKEFTEDRTPPKDKLKIVRDPQHKFWLTKPGLRKEYTFKREYEPLYRLDAYQVPNSQLENKIAELLYGYIPRKVPSLRQLCDSPYIYGADMEPIVVVKHQLKTLFDQSNLEVKFTTGAIDIENEIGGEGRINVCTFVHEKNIYTAALNDYMFKVDKFGHSTPATEVDVYEKVKEHLSDLLLEHNFQLEVCILPTELDLLQWIFSKIHESKTDFIGVWNMAYDIPYILKRLEVLNQDPARYFCHPDVPEQYRYVKYIPDHSKELQHITDKWDMFYCSSYSQFYDSMCLYSRLRRTKGREPSYSLDAISRKEIGDGKIHLSPLGTNHELMQRTRFVDYITYNIKDAVLVQLMEFKNRDTEQLYYLTGSSMIKDFNKQTVMGRNNLFFYMLAQDKIIATAGSNMEQEHDKYMGKAGGAVLSPVKAKDIGACVFSDAPDYPTRICVGVNDLDVASEYPSIISTFNISRTTKLGTVLDIQHVHSRGVSVEDYFANITALTSNCMYLGHKYFKLPNYCEIDKIVEQIKK